MYNRHSLDDRDNDARLGVLILRFGYSVGFIITFIMSPLFMRLLFTIINKLMFPSNSDISDPTGSDSKPTEITGRQDESESQDSDADNNMETYNYKPIFMAGSAISFIYSASSISIGCHQAISRFPLNEFEYMKMIFLFLLVAWLTIIAVILTKYYTNSNQLTCIKKVVTFFCALSLAVLHCKHNAQFCSNFPSSLCLSNIIISSACPPHCNLLLHNHTASCLLLHCSQEDHKASPNSV